MSDVGFPGPIADTPEPETSIRFAIDQLEALDRFSMCSTHGVSTWVNPKLR